MSETAPSRFWVAQKDGTPVCKFDNVGETEINLPDGLDAVPVDSRDDLTEINTDPSVLTEEERQHLGL